MLLLLVGANAASPLPGVESLYQAGRRATICPVTTLTAASQAQLQRHLEALVGERHPAMPAALQRAQDYIAGHFTSLGYQARLDAFAWRGQRYDNVVAVLPGRSASRLILGAHFDTVEGTPGADDNASGVAVLLEAARLLAPQSLDCTLECVAFNLEELNMVGSGHYVQTLTRSRAPVIGMYSLEMVGFTNRAPHSQELPAGLRDRYPSTGDFLAVIGNRRSHGLLRETMRGMRAVAGLPAEHLIVPMNGWWLPATRLSDHAPFWDAGYSALLLTDTAFLRNPHYHQPTDTLETLDLEFMARVCAGVIAAVQGTRAAGEVGMTTAE